MATIKQYKTSAGKTLYEIYVYIGRDDLTGKKRWTHRRGFGTKKEATLAASRLTLDAASDDLTKRKSYTFEQVFEQWYAGYVNTVRESTYNYVRNNFNNHILPLFGRRRIDEITTAQLQKAVNLWATQSTQNYARWLRAAGRVLAYAQQQGYIGKNPAKAVSIPKKQPKAGDAPENFWDRDELTRFFSYIDAEREPEKLALFRVLAFAGLRRGECLALTWGDISLTEGSIRINKTLTQGLKGRQIVQAPKTKKGRRTVSIDPKTVEILRRWRLAQIKKYIALGFNTNKPDQLVFATIHNTHKFLNQPEKWLKAIEDAHGIEHRITVHGFRHSHASALFAAGATIKEVQERLGHEDAQTTLNIYTHVTQKQNEIAAERVAAYLGF